MLHIVMNLFSFLLIYFLHQLILPAHHLVIVSYHSEILLFIHMKQEKAEDNSQDEQQQYTEADNANVVSHKQRMFWQPGKQDVLSDKKFNKQIKGQQNCVFFLFDRGVFQCFCKDTEND